MNEGQLKLLEAGAIKGMTIIGQGGSRVLLTGKGEVRRWIMASGFLIW